MRRGTAELLATALALVGLVGCVLARRARLPRRDEDRRADDRSRPAAGAEFVLSLVPIALVYAVAHYFTLFVIQGQYALSLASDPFGFGWDLFGTVDYAPEHRAVLAEHGLVRPGGRARRRARGRARGRARSRGRDPPGAGRAPVAVRDARC